MKLELVKLNGLKFYVRKDSSDYRTLKEVITDKAYFKYGFNVNKNEKWYDLGGNVGAFAVLACSMGADVEVFEPDPNCCELMNKNLKLNGLYAKIHNKAIIHDDRESCFLFIGKNQNFWRNSIVKKKGNAGLKVGCVNINKVLKENSNVKMDIEGAEMPILENLNLVFNKMVVEWSFDVDSNLERYWAALDKLKKNYRIKCPEFRDKGITIWPGNWFPKCTSVFCWKL